MDKKKKKPKTYIVVLAFGQGEVDGVNVYHFKYVSAWPANVPVWGEKFEVSPNKGEAVWFDLATALGVVDALRSRNAAAATVMVEEA